MCFGIKFDRVYACSDAFIVSEEKLTKMSGPVRFPSRSLFNRYSFAQQISPLAHEKAYKIEWFLSAAQQSFVQDLNDEARGSSKYETRKI